MSNHYYKCDCDRPGSLMGEYTESPKHIFCNNCGKQLVACSESEWELLQKPQQLNS